MADGLTTYGVINQRTAAWAATQMLRHAEPVIVLGKFGMVKELPRQPPAPLRVGMQADQVRETHGARRIVGGLLLVEALRPVGVVDHDEAATL